MKLSSSQDLVIQIIIMNRSYETYDFWRIPTRTVCFDNESKNITLIMNGVIKCGNLKVTFLSFTQWLLSLHKTIHSIVQDHNKIPSQAGESPDFTIVDLLMRKTFASLFGPSV